MRRSGEVLDVAEGVAFCIPAGIGCPRDKAHGYRRRGPFIVRRVGVGAAVQCVSPCAADQRIVARAPVERVRARITPETVACLKWSFASSGCHHASDPVRFSMLLRVSPSASPPVLVAPATRLTVTAAEDPSRSSPCRCRSPPSSVVRPCAADPAYRSASVERVRARIRQRRSSPARLRGCSPPVRLSSCADPVRFSMLLSVSLLHLRQYWWPPRQGSRSPPQRTQHSSPCRCPAVQYQRKSYVGDRCLLRRRGPAGRRRSRGRFQVCHIDARTGWRCMLRV